MSINDDTSSSRLYQDLIEKCRGADSQEIALAAVAEAPSRSRRIDLEWADRSEALAEWTLGRLVNRTDAYGYYLPPEKRRNGQKVSTVKSPLSYKVALGHYRSLNPGGQIGVHAIVRDEAGGPGEAAACWSRFLAIDIDLHEDGSGDAQINFRFAQDIHGEAVAAGFSPLLLDSNGAGGFHVLVIFDGPAPSAKVHAFGKWLIRNWKAAGLAKEPEVFPKQPSIEAGKFGNLLRLPGRHHTRPYHTRVWNATARVFVEGAEAVQEIIGTVGTPSANIPAEALSSTNRTRPTARHGDQRPSKLDGPTDAELAADALKHIGGEYLNDYDHWLEVGFALCGLGPVGLRLWEDWSQGCLDKYAPGACAEKWASMKPDSGITLGSLFHWAKEAGWPGPPRPSNRNHAPDRAAPDRDPAGHPTKAESPAEPELANFEEEESDDGNMFKSPLRIRDIEFQLRIITGGWPNRVGHTLFAEAAGHKPVYLDSAARLFAYVDSRASVNWTKGGRYITQERLFEHLRMTSPEYEAIETLPHWPRLPGIYYMHQATPRPSGKLNGFLSFFCPASDEDRELLLAFLLTLFWGGPPGSRPAFLFTGPDVDPHQGRGVGKTKVVDKAAELVGGYVDVAPTDAIADVKTRLLSDDARQRRLARLDNIKTLKLSWADLEGLITSSEISGRALYRGEGRRPNVLVWALTLNGASLSKDMAQRVIPVKLKRPTLDVTWDNRVTSYLDEHRWDILADIGQILECDGDPITPRTRWAVWEQQVLSKTSLAAECQGVIAERQESMDDDENERGLVAEHFRATLKSRGHDPDTECIMIPHQDAADWLSYITRTHFATNRASAYLDGLKIAELSKSKRNDGVRWIWRGSKVASAATPGLLKPLPPPRW